MQYCSTCVSSNRSCVKLSDLPEFWEIINFLRVDLLIATDFICWECRCIFKRITRFRKQIIEAQNRIKNCAKTYQIGFGGKRSKKIELESLSHLSITTKKIYDNIYIEVEKENEIEYHVEKDIELEYHVEKDIELEYHVKKGNEHEYHVEKVNKTEYDDQSETCDAEYLDDDFVNAWDNDDIDVKEIVEEFVKNESTTDNYNETVTDENEMTEIGSNSETQHDNNFVNNLNLSKDKQKFTCTIMTMEEMFKTRDLDRNSTKYKTCQYKCTKCVKGYFDEHKYRRHMRLHDEGQKNDKSLKKCTICSLWFRHGRQYNYHYYSHFWRYTCKSCDFTQHKLGRMRYHHAKEHSTDANVCEICNKIFEKKGSLQYHLYTKHREKPKCEICGKIVCSKASLKVHMRMHTVPDQSCGTCGRLVRASCLRRHARTHAACKSRATDDPYCPECDISFGSQTAYKHHLKFSKAHRQDDSYKYVCSQCPSKFVTKYALDYHVAAKHLKEHRCKCDICGKTFMRKNRLSEHIKEKHEGEQKPKDKICSYCGKAFHTNALLKNHIRIHTGERPFACAHCPATFTQRSTMQTHAKALHKNVNT